MIVNSDALLHIHLPNGPTAYYRLSSIRYCKEIKVSPFHVKNEYITKYICIAYRIEHNTTTVDQKLLSTT